MKYLTLILTLAACDVAGRPAPGTNPSTLCIKICSDSGICTCSTPKPPPPPGPKQCPADPQWPC